MKQLATVVAGLAVLVLALATGALAGTPGGPGAVYALTNSAQGNAVAVYDRAADGYLSSPRFYPTAGLGSGAGGLGSQGGVALTADGHVLLAVNAGSNTVSAFAVTTQWVAVARCRAVLRVAAGQHRRASGTLHSL